MPDSAPAPKTWRQLYSAGLRASPRRHGERAEERHAERLADHEAAGDRRSSGARARTGHRSRAPRPRSRTRRPAGRNNSSAVRAAAAGGLRATRSGHGSSPARAARGSRARGAALRPPRRASAATRALAWVMSAFRSGGGRVGMKSARITPASVACRPAPCTHTQSTAPSSRYGDTR